MRKSKIQNPKSKINFVICALSFGILIAGCATVKETAKGFAGVSTRQLEAGRKEALAKTFNYGYPDCYHKTLEILKQLGAHIYAREIEKQMIAVYVSPEDTTCVGVFFKKLDASRTQVEVSSDSASAKESLARKLFAALEKSLLLQ